MLLRTKSSRDDTMKNDAIGVFDSGMGGLTAVKELNAILRELPLSISEHAIFAGSQSDAFSRRTCACVSHPARETSCAGCASSPSRAPFTELS